MLVISVGRPLLHLGLNLFQKHGLLDHFKLDILKLHKFLSQVESSYHLDNLYHNSIHAADVTQALQCLISDPIVSICYVAFTESLLTNSWPHYLHVCTCMCYIYKPRPYLRVVLHLIDV